MTSTPPPRPTKLRLKSRGPKPRARPAAPPPPPPAAPSAALDSPPPSPTASLLAALHESRASPARAAHWEAVYGAPLHGFSPYVREPDGSARRLPDAEFAAHVRARLWEAGPEHLAEERARRERHRAEAAARDRERLRLEREREEAQAASEGGRKAPAGRDAERARRRWERYVEAWDAVLAGGAGGVPWPTRSGRLEDVGAAEVAAFFQGAAGGAEAVLKAERVRWHPDRVSQRVGPAGLGEEDARGVTAVFQIVDRLYGEARAQAAAE